MTGFDVMGSFPFLEHVRLSLLELAPGEDPHEHTAKKFFGEVTPETRERAKALNYLAAWTPSILDQARAE